MENDKSEKKYRVQLDFTEEAFGELNALQKQLNACSRAEVVRNALGVLKWAIRHKKDDNQIIVECKDGKKVVVEIPFLLI